jgi:amidase
VIPIAHSQDTAGPMARAVADAAILLGVLIGHDKSDSTTAQSKQGEKDYTKFLDINGLQGARIGVVRELLGRNAKQDAIIESHLEVLKQSGAILVDVALPKTSIQGNDQLNLLLYEFKADLNKYLAERNSPYKTLADLIKFNEENKEKEMPLFGQELFLDAEKKGDLNQKEYLDILQRLKTRRDCLARSRHNVVNGGNCRLSVHHRSRGFCRWNAGRNRVFRSRFFRAATD